MDTTATTNDEQHDDIDNITITTTTTTTEEGKLRICSLSELQIDITEEIRSKLSLQYSHHYHHHDDDKNGNDAVVSKLLESMKHPPTQTICRVNNLLSTRQDVISTLKTTLGIYANIQEHKIFDDVVVIDEAIANNSKKGGGEVEGEGGSSLPSLYFSSIPHVVNNDDQLKTAKKHHDIELSSSSTSTTTTSSTKSMLSLFDNWPSRKSKGWPMTHRVVIVDRFCGEAVLRGSNIFMKGVICADVGIKPNETVAVYADIPSNDTKPTSKKKKKQKKITRGLVLDKYDQCRCCVFLGLGITTCSRQDMFRETQGVAIRMCRKDKSMRVGPYAPPLSGILTNQMILQNLPSIMVGHILNPQQNDVILDMCCAPGGKSQHLASLISNQGTIIACDKSQKKMLSAKTLFDNLNATCITPLALDSTKCCCTNVYEEQSIQDIIESAPIKQNGLKDIKNFPPESFDRILLDPPCSALGLRPKLFIPQQGWSEIIKHSEYQKKFVREAVQLLRPGGYITYSTCTINALENECIVAYALQEFSDLLELRPINIQLGQKGLHGHGLNEEQCHMVRRFDPALINSYSSRCGTNDNSDEDTMGFFLALFQKKEKKELMKDTKRKRADDENNPST